MSRIVPVLVLLFAIVLANCAPATTGPKASKQAVARESIAQKQVTVREQIEYEKQLLRVAYPMMVANKDYCGRDVSQRTGLMAASLDVLDPNYRGAYARLYGISSLPTLIFVVPGSAAEKAGFEAGDVVRRVNGRRLVPKQNPTGALFKTIQESNSGSISIEVGRADGMRRLTLRSETACSFGIRVSRHDSVNAAADGKNVYVTTGMLRFVKSEAETALIVGHEMAHNSEGHARAKKTNEVVGKVAGSVAGAFIPGGGLGVAIARDVIGGAGGVLGRRAFSQGFEKEADYVGTYFAARAGYDVSGAQHIWRRMASTAPGGIDLLGSTHPSNAERFVVIGKTVQEIKQKKSAGRPLNPHEKHQAALARQ